jgi:signal peptidase II
MSHTFFGGPPPVKLTPARRNDLIMAALALAVIFADQLTKSWIVQYFRAPAPLGKPPISIVGEILQLQYVQNTGVAFSLLQGQSVLFIFIAVALVVIGTLYWRMRETGSLAIKLTFGLILGGAFGNLIDRLRHAYVVDFIHFHIPAARFEFPLFNVADSAISIGVVLLAFLLWRSAPAHAPSAPDPVGPADRSGSTALGEGSPPRSAPAPRVRNPRARANTK